MSGISSQSILSRAISVYSIPPELLSNLTVRSIQQGAPDPLDAAPSHSEANGLSKHTVSGAPRGATAAGTGVGGTLRCQTCPNAGFETVEEQREHFKSDWHRYNAKAKLTGRIVTAEEWDNMVEGECDGLAVIIQPPLLSVSHPALSATSAHWAVRRMLINQVSLPSLVPHPHPPAHPNPKSLDFSKSSPLPATPTRSTPTRKPSWPTVDVAPNSAPP
jgi:hypothetical protein